MHSKVDNAIAVEVPSHQVKGVAVFEVKSCRNERCAVLSQTFPFRWMRNGWMCNEKKRGSENKNEVTPLATHNHPSHIILPDTASLTYSHDFGYG
ncbi:MAG: hypothetical protein WBQ72_08165 [Terriglobales bacterium]